MQAWLTDWSRKKKEVAEVRWAQVHSEHVDCIQSLTTTITSTGTKVSEKVLKIITSTYLRSDVRKLSSGMQTSSVKAFHSVLNHFVPKLLSFSYERWGAARMAQEHLSSQAVLGQRMSVRQGSACTTQELSTECPSRPGHSRRAQPDSIPRHTVQSNLHLQPTDMILPWQLPLI